MTGPRVGHSPHWPLYLIVLAYAVACLAIQFIVRLDYGPDEPFHLDYAHVLAWEHRLPLPPHGAGGVGNHLVQHPPPYYVAVALLWRAVGAEQRPMSLRRGADAAKLMTPRSILGRRLIRGVSTLLGCLTLLVLARLLETLAVPRWWQTVLLAAVALNPMFQYIGAVANNEIASVLYCSIVCLSLVRRFRAGQCSPAQAWWLGLLAGAGQWVKQTTLLAVPAALWMLWLTGDKKQRPQRLGLFLAGVLLGGIGWPLRNYLVEGRWFPFYIPPPNQERQWELLRQHPQLGLEWLRSIFETGFLPDWAWMFFPREVDTIAACGGLLALLGLFIFGLTRRADVPGRQLRAMAALTCGVLLAGILNHTIFKDYRAAIGGRYLLNGLPWLVTFLATFVSSPDGEPAVVPRYLAIGLPLGLALLLAFDLGWWFIVWTHYTGEIFR